MKIIGFKKGTTKKGSSYALIYVNSKTNDKDTFGLVAESVWIFGELADKLPNDCIGKTLCPEYGCGYDGKAFIKSYTLA